MYKKFLSVLLFILMLVSLLPSGAMAAAVDYQPSLETTIPGGYTLKAVKYTHRCENVGVMKNLEIKNFKRNGHTAQFEVDVYIKCEVCNSYMRRVTTATITIIDDCKKEADTLFSIDGGNMGGQIDFILTSPAVGGEHVPAQKYDDSGHWDGCSKCSLQENKTEHSLDRYYDADGHWDDCSKCDYLSKKASHSTVVTHDKNGHWNDCSRCDYASAPIAHSPVVKFNAGSHWDGCAGCNLRENETGHNLVQQYDADNHWDDCANCDYQQNITPHSPVVTYDENGHWNDCSACDYASSAVPHSTIVEFDTENHWNGCADCDSQRDITPHSMRVSGKYHSCRGCEYTEYVAPETGDSANLGLWIGLMAVSAASAALFIRRSRKEY